MPYYIRVLSPTNQCVPLTELQASLVSDAPNATLSLESGSNSDWDQVVLSHPDGTVIAVVERNPVAEGSLASEELQEFREEIADCAPGTAVEWLTDYFSRVRTIYAFQLLSGTESEGGWDILGALKETLLERGGGIIQADGEGFSNEEGYHILWQFSDSVSGPWWMGVLREGAWVHFEMELGDPDHRQAFFMGEVPQGVRLA